MHPITYSSPQITPAVPVTLTNPSASSRRTRSVTILPEGCCIVLSFILSPPLLESNSIRSSSSIQCSWTERKDAIQSLDSLNQEIVQVFLSSQSDGNLSETPSSQLDGVINATTPWCLCGGC
ncbi:hypothetical protein TNIN_46251 [Trichonephila inaurata madagascariensis]|uniref:Uncharacterized protein n=1 Tax=Trichonephila inaurata madagascariensis TaxID=2747483 RepID=A0A8X6JT12_9ARAC|nr:hypothetical protein TNIN_46251 [Trichonephila inaurata madagascariensis]